MTRNGRVYIPLDVIDLILGILHGDGDKSSLSACSRVCHEFLHCCRRRLFPTIRYSGVFTLLLTFLQDSQHLRVYIRQLTLHGKYLDVSELLAIIELLPSLQDLTLSGISPYYKDDTLSKALCYSRHLKTLHLEEVIECYEDFASPEHGLDTGSVISMFPDVGDLTLSKVDSNPDDIMVDRPCIKDFRTNVERSLHSLGPKTRINPRTISISGQVFPAASLRVVSQLCFPSLDIVLDIRPQDKIPDAALSFHHDTFSNANYLQHIGLVGYVYPYRNLASVIWGTFEELLLILPRKTINAVKFHIHYPVFCHLTMSATLRALSQKDWGQIRECLDEMKSLKTLTLFFSYHWEYIVPNRVDDLIKLDQRWEEVVKEKLPRLHQRGMIQFESSIKHHIHRFKS